MTHASPLPDLVMSIDIQAPVQRVWDEITKLGKVQRFIYNTVLDTALRPGARLRYYSPNRKRVFVVGEILAVEPPKKFSHTYLFTMQNEQPSVVTWELSDIPGGCRVKLTHSGFTDQVKTHKSHAGGWRQILGLLKKEVETGDIPLGTKLSYAMMGAMSFALPKSTLPAEVAKIGY